MLACLCMCGIQSRLVYLIGPLERTSWVRSSALVCVDRWRGHSRCRAPLTTWLDIYPGSYHLHTVCLWWSHSHCRAPFTTGVDIYPRVLPSAYCVLVAGPLPFKGALNHWGKFLPQGPTIQNNNQLKKSVCKNNSF